jgi:fatty acid/phospholipid biosynthesis enzyme
VCGTEYGDFADHIPDADDGDCTTPITCLVCGETTVKANESHTGGKATCQQKAVCEICGTEYGELEEHKGSELQHETYAMLKDSDMTFVGNVEARDVPAGAADVIVADGFAGNVLLKTLEGTVSMLLSYIKQIFYTNLFTKLAALVIKPHLAGLKKKLSTEEHGGAPLLGVTKPVIKAHGNSKAKAIQNAIRVAAEFAEADVIGKITEAVKGEKQADGAGRSAESAD